MARLTVKIFSLYSKQQQQVGLLCLKQCACSRVIEAMLTCCSGNWDDKGPQSIVIVVLLGQLLL